MLRRRQNQFSRTRETKEMRLDVGRTFGATFASEARIPPNWTAILPSTTRPRANGSAQYYFCRCRATTLALSSRYTNLRNGERLGKHAFRPTTVVAFRNAYGAAGRYAVAAARAALVQKVSAKELDQYLASERTKPLVVDFYATWCGPCIVLAEQLETLAVQYGDNVRFLKVDTEEEYELAQRMQIRGFPTMVFVSKDPEKPAVRTEGLLQSLVIRDIIEKEL